MDFMNVYFKKKNTNALWNPSYYQNKRKRDNVDVAVKKLKRLIEPEVNKKDDDVKVENKDVIIEKSVKGCQSNVNSNSYVLQNVSSITLVINNKY